MNFETDTLLHTDARHLWLELPPLDKSLTEQCEALSTSSRRWSARIHLQSAQALLDWFQEEGRTATLWPTQISLLSLLECVDGIAMRCAGKRVVLLASESLFLDGLRMPQEWVDVPDMAGDFYLVAQVDISQEYVRLWGFASHQQLKATGTYDPASRTYFLPSENLLTDFACLSLALDYPLADPVRSAMNTPAPLDAIQAGNLIVRLGDPTLVEPRLTIPFTLWSALLNHPGWRQRLGQRRRGLAEENTIGDWLRNGVSALGRQLGWERQQLQFQAASKNLSSEQATLMRPLQLSGQDCALEVQSVGTPEEGNWRFVLRSLVPGRPLPPGCVLKLLTEELKDFEGNTSRASGNIERLFVEVNVEPGEGLVWEVEPESESYEREIMRF